MSERCHGCRTRRSHGSIGQLRYCFACFAALCGWKRDDARIQQRVVVQLHNNDGEPCGEVEWMPDAARAATEGRADA